MPDGDSWFGSFSGIDLAPDGLGFVIVSDLGYAVTGRFVRDADGTVLEMDDLRVDELHDDWPAPRETYDSEGVTILQDGAVAVSVERGDRIVRFPSLAAPGTMIATPEDLRGLPWNKGIEALATAPDGAVLAIAEGASTRGAGVSAYVQRDGVWQTPFTIPAAGNWLPVGADFGPDGRLYLLERDFWGLVGFKSRVRRITIAGDAITADEVLLQTRAGRHDNLEGIATWRDAAGRVRLTMVSDDNRFFLQETQIVDYVVTE